MITEELQTQKQSPLQRRIDSLDWECSGADTRYLTHGIHRYSGKFIPQIARQVIDLVTKPDDLILDLYCGSGTTLLEAALSGRRAIGIDMNPLAVLLAELKCTPIPRESLDGLIRRMEDAVSSVIQGDEPNLFRLSDGETLDAIRNDPRWRNDWYRKWFDERGLFQLIGIHRAICNVADSNLRRVALAAFSDILRRCSHARGGYPNVMYDKRRLARSLPAPLFLSRLRDFCIAIAELTGAAIKYPPDIREGDARATGLSDCSIDAIITHPPYIGSIPYAEYGALSLTWLGHDPRKLDNELTGGKRQSSDVRERFENAYGSMFREAYRVLKPNAPIFLLVGHPLVKGERINLGEMTIRLATEAGFLLQARGERIGVNRRANKMGSEDILFLHKPKSE